MASHSSPILIFHIVVPFFGRCFAKSDSGSWADSRYKVKLSSTELSKETFLSRWDSASSHKVHSFSFSSIYLSSSSWYVSASYSPKSFAGSRHVIRARLALPEEIAARRNLAFNCYDEHGDTGFYPHASANVETRGEAVFAARNAIDGIFENSAHGEYPYQSWGINRDPNAALTLDFGREVLLDELRITERADFPHDNYWVKATVEFSDGSTLDIPLVKSAKPQRVTFEPKRVRSLVLKDLIQAEGTSPFPALTQIEAFGTEVK